MNTRYKILFITELLHNYYANSECSDFEIFPSAESAIVLKGLGSLYKIVGNKLIVLIRVDDLSKPLVEMSATDKLTFYLKQSNPHFNNFTNLGYIPSQPLRYYFTNLNQNNVDPTHYLTHKIAEYADAATYAIGSLAANSSGEVYEAIKLSSNSDKHDLSQTSYWLLKDKNQYVSNADLIPLLPAISNYSVASNTNFTIRVFGINAATGVFDVLLYQPLDQTYPAPQTSIPVDLKALPTGRYKVVINTNETMVYIDSAAVYQNVFGIIEIYNSLPDANAFSLFNAGVPKENTYTIRFANRSVIWKYLARSMDVTSIHHPVLSFTPVDTKIFASVNPIPFKETPVDSITLESATLGSISPLANPATDRLNQTTQGGETYLCAEMYLNY